jgi:anhydro-N-acetylmuramic acid kinase
MQNKIPLALGLMSGTSADGLTIAALNLKGQNCLCYKTYPYTKKLQKEILNAVNYTAPKLAKLDYDLGRLYLKLTKRFIKEFNLKNIKVIGCHGQTICHNPKDKATMQIGQGAFLAKNLKIPVVNNFRAADIALGATGAPLMPIFDEQFFKNSKPIILLNLGGIANFSLAGKNIKTFGFDIGPANALSDNAVSILTKDKKTFDKNGSLAAKYTPDINYAQKLVRIFMPEKPGISLDRNAFGTNFLNKYFPNLQEKDISTLNYFTALLISQTLKKFVLSKYKINTIAISGGGIFNKTLISNLQNLTQLDIINTIQLGLEPMAKEALAMAYFAWQTINKKPLRTTNKIKTILGEIILP